MGKNERYWIAGVGRWGHANPLPQRTGVVNGESVTRRLAGHQDHGMVILDDLTAFLNDFMGDVGDKDPHMPNGLQVRGQEDIKLLGTGVSASMALFQEAVAARAGSGRWPLPGDAWC